MLPHHPSATGIVKWNAVPLRNSLEPDASTLHFNQALGDKTNPALCRRLTRFGVIRAEELEHLLVFRHPNTVILHHRTCGAPSSSQWFSDLPPQPEAIRFPRYL